MKPIPRSLLIHSVKAISYSEPDMWGKAAEQPSVDITNVRIEPSSALKVSSRNEQVQVDAVLIYDCRNSRPKGHDFSHTEKIIANGSTYKVVSVEKLFDESRLHHLEVSLCL